MGTSKMVMVVSVARVIVLEGFAELIGVFQPFINVREASGAVVVVVLLLHAVVDAKPLSL